MRMTGDGHKTRVLIVDDDPASLLLLEKLLASTDCEVRTAVDGLEAMRSILDFGPDLLVTDWRMPRMDGLELCRAIRSNEACGFIYVILVTVRSDENSITDAFAAGVDDFLAKPFQRKELLARVRAGERIIDLQRDVDRRTREMHRVNAEMSLTTDKLAIANEKLTCLATTDELTGLFNRREAMSRFNEHWASIARYEDPISCIMLDIDHFKKVNDTWGHDAWNCGTGFANEPSDR